MRLCEAGNELSGSIKGGTLLELALLLSSPEILVSNLVPETWYSDEFFLVFFCFFRLMFG